MAYSEMTDILPEQLCQKMRSFTVILPKESCITDLVMPDIHEVTSHGDRNHILSHLHRKFWVVKANSTTRRIIGRCEVQKTESQSCSANMADLPRSGVNPEEASFTRVGVDYFGPIEVKRGRSVIKRYGVVFTCLAVRALHIEKSDTLETDSCICAICPFIARIGQVQEVWSVMAPIWSVPRKSYKNKYVSGKMQIHNELCKTLYIGDSIHQQGLTFEECGRGCLHVWCFNLCFSGIIHVEQLGR